MGYLRGAFKCKDCFFTPHNTSGGGKVWILTAAHTYVNQRHHSLILKGIIWKGCRVDESCHVGVHILDRVLLS